MTKSGHRLRQSLRLLPDAGAARILSKIDGSLPRKLAKLTLSESVIWG